MKKNGLEITILLLGLLVVSYGSNEDVKEKLVACYNNE